MANSDGRQEVIVTVKDCSACRQTHDAVMFYLTSCSNSYPYSAKCPQTGATLYMHFNDKNVPTYVTEVPCAESDEEIMRLRHTVAHWKSNHDNQVRLKQLVSRRTDLPLHYSEAFRQLSRLVEENRRLRATLLNVGIAPPSASVWQRLKDVVRGWFVTSEQSRVEAHVEQLLANTNCRLHVLPNVTLDDFAKLTLDDLRTAEVVYEGSLSCCEQFATDDDYEWRLHKPDAASAGAYWLYVRPALDAAGREASLLVPISTSTDLPVWLANG